MTWSIRRLLQRETPLYFVNPSAFNLLGLEDWLRELQFITRIDGFDGRHPDVFVPPGSLAAGYGMPAIFTPAGVGTEVAHGKEVRQFNGKDYLLEMAFDADFAIVKAWKGDTEGNLLFRETARNFNPLMAMAGRTTIAEVEELVPAGELDPNTIHTPGIYVHRIFQGKGYEKRIEQRTTRIR